MGRCVRDVRDGDDGHRSEEVGHRVPDARKQSQGTVGESTLGRPRYRILNKK